MNFLGALTSHVVWKNHLKDMIDGNKGNQLDISTIHDDRACELGQWFQRNKKDLSSYMAFEEAKVTHYLFHEAAAQVVKYVREKRHKEAERLLNGEYSKLSHQLQIDLRSLAKELE